ncbi:MAG: choice-of-anchor J domain-containing protein [Bacteroides sp.]|nr:choice-of-anchor J domain-containing protein [Bacteroides sp.]MCM1085197.1 choice-of-anchor J domain-containing protein [Bacteroides sp.]
MKAKAFFHGAGLFLALFFFSFVFTARAENLSKGEMIDSLGSFEAYQMPPAEWSTVNHGVSSWSKAYQGAAETAGSASVSNNENNDTWLITPQLIPTADNHELTFYIKAGKDTMDQTVFNVLLSESTPDLTDFKTDLLEIRNESKGSGFTAVWQKQTVDLSAYNGKAIFLAFRLQKNDLAQIYLDEVAGIPLARFDNDINLKSIFLSPDYVVFAGDRRTINVLAENRGKAESEVTGTLTVNIDGAEGASPIIAKKMIAAGAVDTLQFSYTFAEVGEYELKVDVPADDNTINDNVLLQVEVHPVNTLVEDFHAGKVRPPKDWEIYTTADQYGTSGWWNTSDGATSSKGCVAWNGVNSLVNGQAAVRALITPQLRVQDGDALSFFAKLSGLSWIGNKPVDAMEIYVLVSQATSGMSDFTDTIAVWGIRGENAMTESWKEYSLDLSKYKDKDIFVAFAMVDSYGLGVYVYLDEVGGNIALSSFSKDARVVMAQMDNPLRYWYAGEQVTVRARVENHGTGNIDNLKVSLYANGKEELSETIAALASGVLSDTLEFNYTIPAAGLYAFEVRVPEDENNINNVIGLSLQAYPVGYFIEGFEEVSSSTFPPKYWGCEKTSLGSYGWSVLNYAGNTSCYRGSAHASSQVGCKLITPLLHLTATDSLCFYASTTWDNGSEYAVLTSTNAKDWDTLAKATILKGGYTLQKFLFTDQNDSFFGNRYVALVSLRNTMNVDEIYGPMLADRADQFALVNAWVDGFAVAGEQAVIKAVVYNDGTQAQSKTLTLYAGGEQVATAPSKNVSVGAYDTVSFSCTFGEAVSNLAFKVELPEDASVFDNTFEFAAHIYEPGLWRFAEGFENTEHPYWTSIYSAYSNPWQAKPSYNPVEPASGENYLHYSFGAAKPEYFVSPLLDLRYDTYEVSLDIYRATDNPTRPDRVELAFGTNPVWEDVVFIDSVSRLTTGYPQVEAEGWSRVRFTVDLKDLAQGFFIMRSVAHVNEYNSTSYAYMRFDNLSIRPLIDKDAEISAIQLSDTLFGAQTLKTALRAVLTNSGTEALTAATIKYGADNTELGSIAWNGSLAPGKDTLITVTEALTAAYKESMEIYVEAEATGDGNALNNRATKRVRVKKAYTLPFVAGFEEENWNKDWNNFSYSADVAQSWFRDTTGEYITAPFGKACANSASLDDEKGAVNPDNWLVTPGLLLNYSKAYLSFYVQAADAGAFAEKFQVLVSTNSNTDSLFFTPIHTETLENNELKHITLELNGYRNEVVHIAFRHFDCTDQYRLLLDSVYVYEPQGYMVNVSIAPEGAGTVQGMGGYMAGEDVELTATANTGYRFTGWYKDNAALSTENPYRFECTGNISLEARFEAITFAVTLSAGEGGSVNPSGTVNVRQGDSLQVAVTASEGYEIEDVKVDGASVGAVRSYTFREVSATHTLAATFKKTDVANEGVEVQVLHVAPNPFTNELRIESSLPVKYVQMVDMQGRTVARKQAGGSRQVVLNLNLNDGLYIVLVETADGKRLMQRVVKTRK